MSDLIKEAQEHVEGMKKTFSLSDVLANKVKYPTDTVEVFLDADAAYHVLNLINEIGELETEAANLEADASSIAGNPDADKVREQIEAKTSDLQAVLDRARESLLTFTLRGIPSKVWRVIDEKARRKFPVDTTRTQDEQREDNIKRNAHVDLLLLKESIVSAVDADGNDIAEFTFEAVESLYDMLYESEWNKLSEMKDRLTFANTLFDEVTVGDADFTPASSHDEATQDTQI